MMTYSDITNVMNDVFTECRQLRDAGQKEYAKELDALSNFNRLADELNLDRKQILWTFLKKHYDGVLSYINGYQSQREDVRGRINDMIVYLVLLRAMIEDVQPQHP